MVKKSSMGNGGIGGSGIFGMIGTTVTCQSTDTSAYCSFVKFTNIIFISVILLSILFFALTVLYSFLIKKRRK
jgi:hypothetical protein